MHQFQKNVVDTLCRGDIGVIPTDTIYGIVGRADMPNTVERIYTVRRRSPEKPCIILIASYDDLKKFSVTLDDSLKSIIESQNLWPGKVSIILPCLDSHFEYLSRGTQSLAFRMPDVPELRDLLTHTGPLIAPSANIEGEPPAITIASAKKYFNKLVDFYVDEGEILSAPSKILKLEGGHMIVVRE